MPIYPDKRDGKYTGRWRVEVQVNGKRLRKRANTQEEAKKLEEQLLARAEAGQGVPVHVRHIRPTTLGEAIQKAEGLLWKGKSSAKSNFMRLEVITSILGKDRPINSIDQEAVDQMTVRLMDRDITPATINRYNSIFGVFLKWCSKRGYYTLPIPTFDWTEESDGRIIWIQEHEERELYNILPEDIARVVKVAIVTGLRRSELLYLRREQVESLQDGRGCIHLEHTKNKRARSVYVPSHTMPHLMWLLNGNMPTASRLRYQWDEARKKLGRGDDFVFHLCRHTCATRMVRAGVHLLTIKEHLGHKRIETTMRYAKLANDMLQDAVDRVPHVEVSTVL